MSPSNTVTLSGQVASEMPAPGKGRTCLFRLEHRQASVGKDGSIQTSSFALWARAWGHAAASILRHGRPGTEIVVSGRLNYLAETASIGLVVDSVSYVRPSQFAEPDKNASD